MRRSGIVLCVLIICTLITGCARTETSDSDSSEEAADTTEMTSVSEDDTSDNDQDSDLFSNRDLSGEYEDALVIELDGDSLTITEAGTYLISGTITDGQIIICVDEDDKVQLVLDGVSVTASSGAAIEVQSADKVFLTLAEGSTNTICAEGDYTDTSEDAPDAAVYALCDLTLNGEGSLEVTSACGHAIATKDDLKITGGTYTLKASGKGLNGNDSLSVADGTFIIDAEDDALHSDGDMTIQGGTFTLTSGDDAVHADGTLNISDGTITITSCVEGLEACSILIEGGVITLTSSDDGINAAGDTGTPSITISGGEISITCGGDGIDSNGSLYVTGGVTMINGPSSSMNGSLDYTTEGTITGGTVIAVGASGMAMNFDSDSTQGSILVSSSQQSSGTVITLTDDDGHEIVSMTATVSFSSVLISDETLVQGETYTLTIGSSSTEITLTSLIYGSGSSWMGGGMTGGGMVGGHSGGHSGGR